MNILGALKRNFHTPPSKGGNKSELNAAEAVPGPMPHHYPQVFERTGFTEDLSGQELPSEGAAASFGDLSPRYSGRNAENYEHQRSGKKWVSEDRIVEQLLAHVGPGSSILDAPVGTGRFFSYFNVRKFKIYGVDASADMIAQARVNAERVGAEVRLVKSDILSLPYDDDTFDLVMSIRFLNLIDWQGVGLVLHELMRVSRDKIMIGIRYFTPFSDLQARPADLLRLAMRLIGVPRYLARRRELMFHEKQALTELLDSLGVEVLLRSYVERRWDGTDYVILLLQKRRSK